ncbi:MAG: sigma 54-interacting transcriptional regulator [Sedimentibacter sp.]|uniref:sigma-54 interaction domain-containing protein n=1 Tax=Sedimentibacter sp. TaxID=1960295 RepID=UPI0031596903
MFEKDSFERQFTDMMNDGFIFIDSRGIIQIYNSKAKEIFGIEYKPEYSHGSGKIEKGDIVIIADSCLGKDDGGLLPESLKCIGIRNGSIRCGDAVVAVGSYKDDRHHVPRYVYRTGGNLHDKLSLDCRYQGIRIASSIDFNNGTVAITADEETYRVEFAKSIGHMVVLDADTKKMKFYQAKGYTARGEDVNALLSGKEFRSKGSDSELFNVIGKNVFEIHNNNSTIKEFYDVAVGNDIRYSDEYKEINGRPTICSLFPVDKGGSRSGAVLIIKDVSEIKKIIRERDEALQNLYKMERKLSDEEATDKLLPDLAGDSKEITNVKKLALKAAKSNSTVLILGESGTGKSMLAKAIHENSSYSGNPFIAVNCSSIPETLLESELFGYEGGAFTGAKTGGKAGLFEAAQGGTLFLDEIGEISMSLQSKLLQVLQDKSYYKVGGKDIKKLDARIIVATNKNLEEEVQRGRFREDLYYRINVFPIWMPPLRERKEDIYTLVSMILPRVCQRTGCGEKGVSGEALRLLSSYDYPGNVRELENILERAVNLAEGKTIFSRHLAMNRNRKNYRQDDERSRTLKEILSEAEKEAIEEAIATNKGDYKAAMNVLDISKTAFYEKVRKHRMEL